MYTKEKQNSMVYSSNDLKSLHFHMGLILRKTFDYDNWGIYLNKDDAIFFPVENNKFC